MTPMSLKINEASQKFFLMRIFDIQRQGFLFSKEFWIYASLVRATVSSKFKEHLTILKLQKISGEFGDLWKIMNFTDSVC